MGLNDHLSKITQGLDDLDIPSSRAASRQRSSGSTPATTSLIHFSEEVAELRKSQGKALRVRMDLCDDGPHHTSPVDPERVENLKSNLQENEQSTPALLRVKEGGRFEIVAGRHRKAALLALGHQEWDAVIKDIDDDAAERLTFYDNLLAPTLTDYARYLGLARRRTSKGFTLEQLAKESGLSRSTVARLLAFGNLPQACLDEVALHPDAIGSKLADALTPFVATHEDKLIQGVRMVTGGTLLAKDLLRWLTHVPAPEKAKPRETLIKAGKRQFAKVLTRDNQITIRLFPGADLATVERMVEDALRACSQQPAPATDDRAGKGG